MGKISDARAARRAARRETPRVQTVLQFSERLENVLSRGIEQTRQITIRLNNILERADAAGFTKTDVLAQLGISERNEALDICTKLVDLANDHRETGAPNLESPIKASDLPQ